MKLLAIETSRITALFLVSRPEGQLFLPKATAMLNARYGFSKYPASYDEMSSERIEFTHGQFNDCAIESLEIYNDGVIITSRSNTALIDNFLTDLTGFIEDTLEMSVIKTHSIDRIYESNLIFESEKELLKPLKAFSEISQFINNNLRDTIGLDVNYQPLGWAMAADQAENPSLKPITFRLERRVGSEFKLNQFVSSAPMQTKDHIKALEQLESLV